MKKILTLVAVLAFSVALVGCGGSSSAPAPKPTTSGSTGGTTGGTTGATGTTK